MKKISKSKSKTYYIIFITVLLLSIFLIIGCGDDDNPTDNNEIDINIPTACFSLSYQLEDDSDCSFDYRFYLDASCSSDLDSDIEDLEIRWDYDNDGTWDTEFGNIETANYLFPDPTKSYWIARCEIIDLDGKTNIAVDSLELKYFPVAPDIIGGKIRFGIDDILFNFVDTVKVGVAFSLYVFRTCYGEFSDTMYNSITYQEGMAINTSNEGCSGSLYGCGGTGFGYTTINTPGVYRFTTELDAFNIYYETNEYNNTCRGTLVVIP